MRHRLGRVLEQSDENGQRPRLDRDASAISAQFPAIDVEQSATRKEELLLGEKELKRVWILRKMMSDLNDPQAAMEFVKGKMEATKDNEQFLELMSSD